MAKNASVTIQIPKDMQSGDKPRLLLHVCCAVCFAGCIEDLVQRFDVTAFFYNPNIQPKEEFIRRFDALKALIAHFPQVKLILPEQDEQDFLHASKGFEHCKEGAERCAKCFRLRLGSCAQYLASHRDEFDCFATTLTLSPHKNAQLLNAIGEEVANEFGVKYLCSDFKKQDGFLRSTRLSKQLGIYRQDYCGCDFSNWHKNASQD